MDEQYLTEEAKQRFSELVEFYSTNSLCDFLKDAIAITELEMMVVTSPLYLDKSEHILELKRQMVMDRVEKFYKTTMESWKTLGNTEEAIQLSYIPFELSDVVEYLKEKYDLK